MNQQRMYLLSQEKVSKALLLLAGPAILSMLTNAIYNFVDALFVGMLNNTAMLAAVTITFPMVMIMAAIGQGLGIGAGSLISRQLGEKKYDLVNKSVFSVMLSGILLSLLGSALLIINLDKILPLFGTTPDSLEFTMRYATWMIIGMISTILNMVMANLIRAEGDVKFPMFAIMAGAIFNIILDPILMFDWGLGLGLEGAAIATIVAHFLSTALLLIRMFRKDSMVYWKPFKWDFNWKISKDIYILGITVFFRQALLSVSLLFTNNAAAVFGTNLVAAIGISQRNIGIVFYILIGYAQALLPFVGYNYGAKNTERVRLAIDYSIKWSTAFMLFATMTIVLFGQQLMQMFTSDLEVIYFGVRVFLAISVALPFLGYYQIHMVVFQALGKARESFILAIARQGIFFIPMILILPRLFAYNGVVFAQPVADVFTVALTLYYSRRLKQQLSY